MADFTWNIRVSCDTHHGAQPGVTGRYVNILAVKTLTTPLVPVLGAKLGLGLVTQVEINLESSTYTVLVKIPEHSLWKALGDEKFSYTDFDETAGWTGDAHQWFETVWELQESEHRDIPLKSGWEVRLNYGLQ